MAGVAVAALVPAAAAGAQDVLQLRADAGLGGASRPGRWTPVRIAVDNAARTVSGEIVVEWGDARLHRAIDLAAPSRSVVELYIRTSDARGSMAVRVVSDGRTIAATDAPIRMVPYEDPLVVCVGDAEPDATASRCTTRMTPAVLPRSMRGYDAADDVVLEAGPESRLLPEQRTALTRWRAYHELEALGLLSRAPRALWDGRVTNSISDATLLACAVAFGSLMCSAWIWVRARGSASRSYAALAATVVIGVLGSVVTGRAGPGSAIVVRQAATLQQVGNGAVVSLRGTIEYPAFDSYAVRAQPADGALTSRSSRTEVWLDANDLPTRRGTFGRGGREEVELDAVADYAPLQVVANDNLVRVSNVSAATLTDCSFPEGFSDRNAGALGPGESVEARVLDTTDAPFFSCMATVSPVSFSDVRFPVRMVGSTIVSVRLPVRLRGDDQP